MSEENKADSPSTESLASEQSAEGTSVEPQDAEKQIVEKQPEEMQPSTEGEIASATAPAKGRQQWVWLFVAVGALAVTGFLLRNNVACLVANYYLQQRKYDEAAWWLNLSSRMTSGDGETEFLLARLARHRGEAGDEERLYEHLERARDLGFDEERIRREYILSDAQSGRLGKADQFLGELARDQQGDGAEIYEAYVMGYIRNYRLNEAVSLITSWAEDYPSDPQPFYLRGYLWQDLYRWKDAEKDFQKAVDLDPDYYEAHLGLGQVLLANKQQEDAIEHFVFAEQKPKYFISSKIGLANCYRVMGKDEEARQQLEIVLFQEPENVDAALELARLEMGNASYDSAYKRLKEMMEVDPRNLDLRFAYAEAARSVGLARDDAAMVEEAQKELAWVTKARVEIDGAARKARDVLLKPKDIDLRTDVAKAYMEYSRPEEGVMWYLSILQIDPGHKPTHEALAKYYETKLPQTDQDRKLAMEHRAQANGVSLEALQSQMANPVGPNPGFQPGSAGPGSGLGPASPNSGLGTGPSGAIPQSGFNNAADGAGK